MGTHPIFESDFDCLTDCAIVIHRESSLEGANHQIEYPNHRYSINRLSQSHESKWISHSRY